MSNPLLLHLWTKGWGILELVNVAPRFCIRFVRGELSWEGIFSSSASRDPSLFLPLPLLKAFSMSVVERKKKRREGRACTNQEGDSLDGGSGGGGGGNTPSPRYYASFLPLHSSPEAKERDPRVNAKAVPEKETEKKPTWPST